MNSAKNRPVAFVLRLKHKHAPDRTIVSVVAIGCDTQRTASKVIVID